MISGAIIDLASRQPGARIAIYPRDAGVEVRLEPPSNRPGARGATFHGFGEARRYAQAMRILLGRPIEVIWGDPGPEAA